VCLLLSGFVYAAAPTVATSNIVFSNVTETSMTVSWTSGNGAARLVIAKEALTISTPGVTNGIAYSVNSNFAIAPGVGSAKGVYNGSGSSFTLTGLRTNKPYTLIFYEYNGTGASTMYLGGPTVTQWTPGAAPQPTVAPSAVQFQVVSTPEYGVKVSWTNGDGSGRLVLVRVGQNLTGVNPPLDGYPYAYNTDLRKAPSQSPNLVVYSGPANSFILTGIDPSTQYGIGIFEYNGTGDPINYGPSVLALIPKSDGQVSMNNLLFQYRYDARNRMIAKKAPGADWVYMVYDNRDRVVLTQDGRQRASTPKYWTFTKYDDLNRPVLSGIKDTTALMTQAEMQNVVDAFYLKGWTRFGEQYVGAATGNVQGYTNKSYPIVGTGSTSLSVNPGPCLSITYYDTYDFKRLWPKEAYGYDPSDPADPIHNLSQEVNGITYSLDANAFVNVKGQVTGTKIKVLDGGVTGGNTWLRTAMYYDDHYRVIQTVGDNYKGGQDRVSNLYDFAGKVLKNLVTHTAQEVSWTDLYNFTTQGNKVIGTGASGWGNSGAASEQVLPAAQDGWFEFVATETTTHRMLGLSQQNTDANFGSIDYAFYLASTGIASVYLHGVSYSGVQAVSYKVGDTLRMVREGTSMKYYKNQSFLGSSSASSAALLIDGAFNTNSATLAGVRSSFSETRKIILRTFEYDHAGRLINTWHKIDTNNPVLLAHNEYNELGQLIDKKIHSTQSTASDALQSIDYAYNIRGWLTNINDASLTATGTEGTLKDFFGMNLNYQDNIASEMGTTYDQGVSGLVSQYDLNGNANDQSPGKLDGTVTGAQLTSDSQGAANQAYTFNGTTDKIVIDGSKDKHSFIKNTGIFTLSAYIKLSDINVRSTIIGNSSAATTKGFFFSFEGASSRRLRFVITAGQSSTYFQAYAAANTIHDSNWHHVAVTGDGKVVRFYVDGVADGTATSITLLDNGSSQFATCIGNDYDTNGDISTTLPLGMHGALDEIKIYNRPLSPTEIQTLTQHNSPGGNPASSPYNGNISSIQWSVNQGLSDVKKMAYTFQYDPMNRLVSANHFKSTGTDWKVGTNNEGDLTYDLQGNIKTLSRYDEKGSLIDFLTYNYTNGSIYGNQLLSLGDKGDAYKGFLDGVTATTEYTYDQNGNMFTDQNKGIGAIAYNHLNLPALVTRGANTVQYIYDAGGRKLSQLTTFNKGQQRTDYMGEFQYENNVLQSVQHEEGRVVFASNKTMYTGSGETTDDVSTTGTAVALVTQKGTEQYVEVSSNGTAGGRALFGGTFPVVAGERYKIRVKGYYTLTSPVYIIAKANNSTGSIGWPGTGLPNSAATESWAEQTIVIPTGATQLQVGISWDAVTSTPKAYVNEIELIQLTTNATPEYQYNMKDHLGNIRLTFTTKDDVDNSLATMEDDRADIESGQFSNYDEAVRVKGFLFDHTKDASDPADGEGLDPNNPNPNGYAVRLNGTENERYGLAKSLSVMPGDVISMEVFGKYLDGDQNNWTTALQNFMASLATGQPNAGMVIDGGAAGSLGTTAFPFPDVLQRENDNGTGPKAYLNWLVFDRDYNFIPSESGFKRLSNVARETGHNTAHEALIKDDLKIKQPGYVYIYLSNENETPVEVYFDDFSVTHTKSPVIQTQDYYPFGLTFNSHRREGAILNRFQYNGKELQDVLNVNWNDYGARMYMSDIGRWGILDPLSEKGRRWSPYTYAFDNPVRFIDPDGMWPGEGLLNSALDNLAKIGRGFSQAAKRSVDQEKYKEVKKGAEQYGKDGKEIASKVEIKASYGKVVGVKAGKLGAEYNGGSKEIGSVTMDGKAHAGDPNKTTSGFAVSYGPGELAYSKEVVTTNGDMGKEKTTEKTSLTVFGLGGEAKQESGGPLTFGTTANTAVPAEIPLKFIKSTEFSISLFIKIEIGIKD
jgi:RHS repeat-associated protein